MKLVAMLLASAAVLAASGQLVRIRGQGKVYRRVRYNLVAVIAGGLMVLTPHTMGGLLGPNTTTWIAVVFAVLALALLFAGEKVGGSTKRRR